VAVLVAPELTKNSNWCSVAKAVNHVAEVTGGGVLPLLSYGNALGAYRIMQNLRLPRFENLLLKSRKSPWAAWIEIGCSLSQTYPSHLLEPLYGPDTNTKRIVFSMLKTPESEKADLAVSIPVPSEFSGHVVSGGSREITLNPQGSIPFWTRSVRIFFENLMRPAQFHSDATVWRNTPAIVGNIECSSPMESSSEAGRLALVGVTTPIHFEDGSLTRAAGWTRYFESEPVVSVAPETAVQLGIQNGSPVTIKRNGVKFHAHCQVSPNLATNCAVVPAHFPEIRQFLPWVLDEHGSRLYCSRVGVEIEPVVEGGGS